MDLWKSARRASCNGLRRRHRLITAVASIAVFAVFAVFVGIAGAGARSFLVAQPAHGAPTASSRRNVEKPIGSVGHSASSVAVGLRRQRRASVGVEAVDADAVTLVAGFASFSVLTGAPIPLVMASMFSRAETVEKESGELTPVPAPPQGASDKDKTTGEPLDLMWAFPSFAVFMEDPAAVAPVGMPLWGRWLCLLTFWPGVIWYLWYKLVVEDDLRQYKGLGIGGSLVIIPFAIGLFLGVFGEFAYGSLEGGPLDNLFATSFYAAFAWIYLNQWFLYNKVNQLFEEEDRPAPLDPLGLFVPGWNFVTGIRQIHFTADYWARQRGQQLPRDAFAELFPFATKPTLSFFELATTPALWFNLGSLIG